MKTPISVIIPAYNEADRIGKTLTTVVAYLEEYCADCELIVVDDGSTDNTAEISERHLARARGVNARVIRNQPNRGKGHAVRTGLLAATHAFALFSDADLSTPITEAPKVMEPIQRDDYDVVFGSRGLDRSLIGVHQPWRREQGGKVFNLIVRLATRMPYWDTQCGFKAFNLTRCRPIIEAATIDRFGFDVELLYVARLAGLRLLECPVRWDHNDGSKISVLRDSVQMFEEVRLIRRQARQGIYEHALAAVKENLFEGKRQQRNPGSESDVSAELASPGRRI
ncbi:MAG: dolichyl-phosphate beta-glucosyltransferase [Pyrinomonadaceae bacterium]